MVSLVSRVGENLEVARCVVIDQERDLQRPLKTPDRETTLSSRPRQALRARIVRMLDVVIYASE
jgi:hypothetical protein